MLAASAVCHAVASGFGCATGGGTGGASATCGAVAGTGTGKGSGVNAGPAADGTEGITEGTDGGPWAAVCCSVGAIVCEAGAVAATIVDAGFAVGRIKATPLPMTIAATAAIAPQISGWFDFFCGTRNGAAAAVCGDASVVKQIDPLPRGEFLSESIVRHYVLDTHRHYRDLMPSSQHKLLFDLIGIVSVGCEDQQH